jgi:hypothetical protein
MMSACISLLLKQMHKHNVCIAGSKTRNWNPKESVKRKALSSVFEISNIQNKEDVTKQAGNDTIFWRNEFNLSSIST